jgi:hypothetical protein
MRTKPITVTSQTATPISNIGSTGSAEDHVSIPDTIDPKRTWDAGSRRDSTIIRKYCERAWKNP